MSGNETESKWYIYLLLILAVVLAWYPTLQDWYIGDQPVALVDEPRVVVTEEESGHEPPDPIDLAYMANPNSRTWEVIESGGHLKLKDRFKIMKHKGGYKLRPLTKLRYNWGLEKMQAIDFQLEKLRVTGETGEPKVVLCGSKVGIPSTQHTNSDDPSPVNHALMIFPKVVNSDKSAAIMLNDVLRVEFFVNPNEDDCETVWNSRNGIRDHHGGVAHIEN